MFKKLLILLLTLSFNLSYAPDIKAEEDVFSVTNKSTYTIDAIGQTSVKQEITFTNLASEYYVPKYELTLGSGTVNNLEAVNSAGKIIQTEITQEANQTVVSFDFTGNVVTPNQAFAWTLTYDTAEVTQKKGMIYEITIPQISNLESFADYQITLEVDKKLGQKNYISPKPESENESDTTFSYFYPKEILKTNTVNAAFGPYQVFDFTLKYQLTNNHDYEIVTEIALPPDKNNQQVFIETIEPKPINTRFDEDGNIMAKYQLAAQTNESVTVSGFAIVSLLEYDLEAKNLDQKIPSEYAVYTKPLPFWESNSDQIKTLANEVTDGKVEIIDRARSIFDYVSTTLTYDDTRLTNDPSRFGAVKALDHKDQAVCMEYTDLFIALLRANNIPARELDGYAYNAKDSVGYVDALHAWVEVYIPPYGWVPMDPTWSGTASSLDYFSKLDTNHLVFVTKGLSSETPYPPGTYKRSEESTGNILVSFAETSRDIDSKLEISIGQMENIFGKYETKPIIMPLSDNKVQLIIKNESPFSLYQGQINAETSELKISLSEEKIAVPPHGQVETILNVKSNKLTASDNVPITLNFTASSHDGKEYQSSVTYDFTRKPLLWNFYPVIIGIIVALLMFGGILKFHSRK